MGKDHLATYLNDHLAGSVSALELLEFLRSAEEGSWIEDHLAELHAEISRDRGELEKVMVRLEIPQSGIRQATAWFTEKLSHMKLRMKGQSATLHRLEALDMLSMGIEGKALLWKALKYMSHEIPILSEVELDRLLYRAEAQRRQVEHLREVTVPSALGKKTAEPGN